MLHHLIVILSKKKKKRYSNIGGSSSHRAQDNGMESNFRRRRIFKTAGNQIDFVLSSLANRARVKKFIEHHFVNHQKCTKNVRAMIFEVRKTYFQRRV